ncbi:plasmid mobilization protein [Nocardia brasiliensis]|uniref:plasmid mobilization protein n=1 Tax=Nocardia brasiliensis TaxID=37326 RepID=UPI003D8A4DAE
MQDNRESVVTTGTARGVRDHARARRRRRQANLPAGTRSESIKITLTPHEARAIRDRARAADVSVQRLIRDTMLAPQLSVSATQFEQLLHHLFRTQTALRSIGLLLKQISVAANSTGQLGVRGDRLNQTLAAVNKHAAGINKAVEAVSSW